MKKIPVLLTGLFLFAGVAAMAQSEKKEPPPPPKAVKFTPPKIEKMT